MSTADTDTFTLFLRLPPELRHQIWIEAVSNCITPTAVPYETGCCSAVLNAQAQSGEDPTTKRRTVYDVLPWAMVIIPPVLTCREARAVALSWLGKQKGIRKLSFDYRFVTGFDGSRDVLYIRPEHWVAFCHEAWTLDHSPSAYGDPQPTVLDSTQRIAIHAENLDDEQEVAEVGKCLYNDFKAVKEVYLVVNLTEVFVSYSIDVYLGSDRWDFVNCNEEIWQRKAMEMQEIIYKEVEDSRHSSLTVRPMVMRHTVPL